MNIALAVFIGGGLGSLSRYGISKLTQIFTPTLLPLGTLIANLLSCLILGLTVYVFKEKISSTPWLMAFIAIGFCGGFSTFSTFSNETLTLIQGGNYLFAVLNILISITLCLSVLFVLARA